MLYYIYEGSYYSDVNDDEPILLFSEKKRALAGNRL